ncbi:lasso peptide biosynthesis B2 protein [Rothia aeria]|uniref:lasso peptide biosynthesis B2 protein n=1 Tax=Rothia aeria TaxID=172042 RepID=UPI00068C6B25|nr:lasso peptide biosynthesis B2 protein [Rothia aeria]
MGDNPTTATDAHTVSSTKARLAMCAAKIIARLPVTVIVRLLKMFRPLQKSSSIQQALAVDAKVREVSPLCRGERGCLARSISTYLLLSLMRRKVVWASGFRVKPFLAHAWVTVEGEPINEHHDVQGFVTVASTDPEAR